MRIHVPELEFALEFFQSVGIDDYLVDFLTEQVGGGRLTRMEGDLYWLLDGGLDLVTIILDGSDDRTAKILYDGHDDLIMACAVLWGDGELIDGRWVLD